MLRKTQRDRAHAPLYSVGSINPILSLVQYFNSPTLMLVVCWAKRSSDGARFENHANFSLAAAGPRAKTGNIWQWTFTLIFGQSSISPEMLFIHVFRSDSNRFHNFFLCFLYWAFFSFTIFYLKKSGIKHPIITYGNKKQREKSRENDEWHFYLKIFSPPLLVLGKKTGNIWAEPTKLGPLFILINFFIYDFFEKTY